MGEISMKQASLMVGDILTPDQQPMEEQTSLGWRLPRQGNPLTYNFGIPH